MQFNRYCSRTGLFTLITSFCFPLFAVVEYGIASQYVRDNGIKNNSSVVFTENFEEGSIDAMLVNWPSFKGKATMSLSPDKPQYSGGNLSLYVSGGWMDMYRKLLPGYDTLYVRYYTKLDPSCTVVHHWPWMGGHYPATDGPWPRAGIPPNLEGKICFNEETMEQRTDVSNCGPYPWYVTGETAYRFSTGVEPGNLTKWDFYSYWPTMSAGNDGRYWGAGFGNGLSIPVNKGQWICIEFMVKLNNPVTSSNGEQAFWINGEKKMHLGQGFPTGRYYNGAWFNDCRTCVPFEGMRWRTKPEVKINYFWLEHFVDTDLGCEGWFDDIVISKKYIGPQVNQIVGIQPSTTGIGGAAATFRAHAVAPSQIRFNMPAKRNSAYSFQVVDIGGRELFRSQGKSDETESLELEWKAQSACAPGIYYAVLKQPGETQQWKFTLVQ